MLPSLLCVLVTHPVAAELLPSSIDADTTLSVAGSPWQATEDLRVEADATLTIEPGVTLQLSDGVSLFIQGTLVARGTRDAPIEFTSAEDASWGSIVFEPGSQDASYQDVHDWVTGSVLEHCRILGGDRAVSIDGASPLVRSCHFEGNSFEPEGSSNEGGAALYVTGGSRARIEHNDFVDNVVGGWGYGGAIKVVEAEPVIHANRFEDNVSVYGGALCVMTSQSPVVGNHFEGNEVDGEGGAVSLYSAAGAFLDNTVIGNESVFDGGGIHLCTGCTPHAAPWMADNVITDNLSRALGAGGVGGAWIRGLSWNDIHGNHRSDEPSDLVWTNEALEAYPAWVHSPETPHNWWGSTDKETIEEAIVDGEDEDEYGVVSWEPAATGPIATPTVRALITTPKLRYSAANDEMTANLVIYNPGEARQLRLRVFLQLAEGPLVPYRQEPSIEGLILDGDSYTVSMPEASVIFAPLSTQTRGDEDTPPLVTWLVTVHDDDSGELLGDAMATPVALAEGGAR